MSLFSREIQVVQRLFTASARRYLPGVVTAAYQRHFCDQSQRCASSTPPARLMSTNAEVLKKVMTDVEEKKQQQNKLFAVVHISGRQYKVTHNDLIVVNQIEADVGEKIFLEKVLLAGSEDFTLIGRPLLSEDLIRITATVTQHTKLAKVIVFKKKRRKNYKRKKGHRQPVTYLRINTIDINSESDKLS